MMKKAKNHIIALMTLVMVFVSFVGSAQIDQTKRDSLMLIWNDASKHDTVRLEAIRVVSHDMYVNVDLDTSIMLTAKQLEYAKKHGIKKYQAVAYNTFGTAYRNAGEYAKAVKYYDSSLVIRRDIGNKFGVGASLLNIAGVYRLEGNSIKAYDFYKESYDTFSNIGYNNGISAALQGLANCNIDIQRYDDAIVHLNEALNISSSDSDNVNVAGILNSLGAINQMKGDLDSALKYYDRSFALYIELGNLAMQSIVCDNMGQIHQLKGNYIKAVDLHQRALDLASEVGLQSTISSAYKGLFEDYYGLKKYKEALDAYQNYITVRDTITNIALRKDVDKQKLEYKYEKQKAANEKEHAVAMAVAQEHEKRQQFAIFAMVVLVVIAGIWIINAFFNVRRMRAKNEVIENQKKIVELQHEETQMQKKIIEEQHKDINDSINYAKRLQGAILPTFDILHKANFGSFLIYRPKDKVAGDFYWIEQVDDVVYVAVADCTGHGVPGAMLSVVCSNALSRVVNEFGILEPSRMLDKARQLIVQTFSYVRGSIIQDGMDVSLVAINTKTKQVQWAGANNGLLYWDGENHIKEVSPDKQPVGYTELPKPFTTHTLQLAEGNKLFLFTDGYADQFGGDKNKKYKHANFLIDLESVQSLSMVAIEASMTQKFDLWRGNNEQTDDVCVIGIQL